MGGFSLREALIVSATGRVFFRPREDLRRVGKRSTGGLALTVQDLRGPQCFRPPTCERRNAGAVMLIMRACMQASGGLESMLHSIFD